MNWKTDYYIIPNLFLISPIAINSSQYLVKDKLLSRFSSQLLSNLMQKPKSQPSDPSLPHFALQKFLTIAEYLSLP